MFIASIGLLIVKSDAWHCVLEVSDEYNGTVIPQVAFSPDGNSIAWSGVDGVIRIRPVNLGQPTIVLKAHSTEGVRRADAVLRFVFSTDGQRIVSGGCDGFVRVWSINETGAPLGEVKAEVTTIAVSPDGTRIAAGGLDNTVQIWEMNTLNEIASLRGHEGRIKSVAYSHDGAALASTSDDGTVRLWNVKDGAQSAIKKVDKRHIWNPSFSVDDRRVVIARNDGMAYLWDTVSGMIEIIQHTNPDFAFNKEAWLWDNHAPPQRKNIVYNLVVDCSADHTRIVAACNDGKVRVWFQRRPEPFWGLAWLPEFWLSIVLGFILIGSVAAQDTVRQRIPR